MIIASFAIAFSAMAQSHDQVVKAVDKAKADTQNEKKATKVATWLKLSRAYTDAYKFPKKEVWIGANQLELKLLLNDAKVISSEVKEFNGSTYTVDTYDAKILYYNQNGILEMIQITKPVIEGDILGMASDALDQAIVVDVKKSKYKDIVEAFKVIRDEYINEGMAAYTLGDLKLAHKNFAASLRTSENPAVNAVDSMMVFYSAVTAHMLGDTDAAIKYYEQCKAISYDQKGDVYSSLADLYKGKGEIEKAKEYLNAGFQKYPSSQAILVSLINLYLESKDDPNKVLELIRTAQANEPGNASLYYAEGNVYKNLNDIENAVKCFWKSYEIDPNYIFGVYTIGSTYFDEAIKVQGEIDKLDVNDVEGYDKLLKEFEDCLIKAIEPFEKAFAATQDQEFKISIADGLKQIYFRFRDRSEDYQKGYDKYNTYLKENDTANAQ